MLNAMAMPSGTNFAGADRTDLKRQGVPGQFLELAALCNERRTPCSVTAPKTPMNDGPCAPPW